MTIKMLELQAAVSKAFLKIGMSNGTAPLSSTDNRASIAHEYYVADKLASIAAKRKEKAKEKALSVGLLGDDSCVPGTTVNTYTNEHFTIAKKVANPASRIDKVALSNELTKLHGAVKAAQIIAAATKENAAAVSYEFVLS